MKLIFLFLCYSLFGVGQTVTKDYRQYYHAVYLKLEQPFGSMANVDGVLFPIKDIEECNKNRLSIGLLPLNQHLMLTGYRIE